MIPVKAVLSEPRPLSRNKTRAGPERRVRAFVAICEGGIHGVETVPQYAKGCKFIRQDKAQKTVKKTSRLKRGVYRATYIVRQSRSLGKNQGLPAPEIRGRSERRVFERKNAKICLLDDTIHGSRNYENDARS